MCIPTFDRSAVCFAACAFCLLAADGCSRSASNAATSSGAPSNATDVAKVIRVGEGLAGDGDELAHINVMIGKKDGPVGEAFANALAHQSEGHANVHVVLEPNLAVKPSTAMVTLVTVKGTEQAVMLFGPAQSAVARAVTDSVKEGIIAQEDCESLVIVCGVFLHPNAKDDQKLFANNYEPVKLAIVRAMKGEPTIESILAEHAESR